jgi:hypothetical protein
VSKERARNRAEREREAAIKQAAKGHEQERAERQLSMRSAADKSDGKGDAITQPQHHKHPKPGAKTASAKKSAGKGRPTPKQSGPRSPANKKRPHAPVGRPDGPLARRRRFRVRLLVVLLVIVNLAVGAIWRDWSVTLAVLILSVITAPLLAALLLRRR